MHTTEHIACCPSTHPPTQQQARAANQRRSRQRGKGGHTATDVWMEHTSPPREGDDALKGRGAAEPCIYVCGLQTPCNSTPRATLNLAAPLFVPAACTCHTSSHTYTSQPARRLKAVRGSSSRRRYSSTAQSAKAPSTRSGIHSTTHNTLCKARDTQQHPHTPPVNAVTDNSEQQPRQETMCVHRRISPPPSLCTRAGSFPITDCTCARAPFLDNNGPNTFQARHTANTAHPTQIR